MQVNVRHARISDDDRLLGNVIGYEL
jgi:hypothetical protein